MELILYKNENTTANKKYKDILKVSLVKDKP